MSRTRLPFIALAIFLVTASSAVAQMLPTALAAPSAPVAAPAPTVPATQPLTAAEAQRALDTLQDDTKRAQMIATLRAIAAATPSSATPASAEPAPTPSPPAAQSAPAQTEPAAPSFASNGLGAQLLLQLSQQLGDMSHGFVTAARTLTDFPLLWHWAVRTANDPEARDLLVDIAWKLVLILGCALAAEWLILRLLRRPLAILEAHVPAATRPHALHHASDGGQAPDTSPLGGSTAEIRRRHSYLTWSWRFLIRLPFMLAALLLDFLPVIAFAAVGTLLLGTHLGNASTPRLVILAIVNAYVLCRGVMCVARALLSPSALSLVTIRADVAAYFEAWTWRIVAVAVFGLALANVALLLGLYHLGYEALVRLVMLFVHLLLVVVVLQCRGAVTAYLRSPEGNPGILATVRNRFASVWHYLAIFLIMATWAVWAFDLKDGYTLLLQYLVGTVVVLILARLTSIVALGAVDRLYRVNTGALRRFPDFEARANQYLPLLNAIVSGFIFIVAMIALLEVWGIDAIVWFHHGQIGEQLVSAIVNIGIASLAALIVWEASNAIIERHLARLVRELHYVRAARLRTFLPMVRTALFCVVVTVVGLTALSEIGVNVAPLLAGAGIIGIAIGFGSQKLVQDVITGLFLLLENVVQVGDFVTVSGLSGSVENLSIRTIRLRAGDGSVHVIPFSSVTSITNTNRGIGNASISVSIPYEEDTDRVGQVLREISAEMRNDAKYRPLMRGDLDLWGIDKVDGLMVTIVGQIECTDSGRWPVQREFNRRMRQRFQELGIELARPVQTIIMPVAAPLEAQPGPDAGVATEPEVEAAETEAEPKARRSRRS